MKIYQNCGPGGSLGLLGGVLAPLWPPRVPQGRPKGAPGTAQGCPRVPQGRSKGAKLEAKIRIFRYF